MYTVILLLIFSYLFGSIPFGLIISKTFYKIDLREHGSGNVGTTNTFRILGKKAGIVVLVLDLLKGAIPVWVALLVSTDVDFPVIIFGVVAAIGHVYSIFLKFKGGKAVATGGGALLAAAPIIFLVVLVTFLVTLKVSKYVSLGSVFAAISLLISVFFTGDPFIIGFGIILGIMVIVKHISNMQRIKEGTEPKITFM
ncbi:glycerol-3-phosphate acyltransferase 2 [Jeotgalicoccus coquinae]|uniref:Glycerol-3-phosphate acyltransferase n=1 Tax=Jeotgalicoccus coquinae TaxID=709509 RepID=A0A6V7R980_9STAP|nr:glycerol-3-phosphate 1-O-acyltransferase PlsY [Jeotgalicoccus coquinae]MBB6423059.1 glycerol-3-phosphate acyltransferase PlsY [Jeotgalicoccus coquinae]GGE11021.1 glycerol-3-phosphate acyltransferase 2 [Jeotgalicoccus coquinae]CAD2073475.1 Glycerol-3-phosphate acyltransferase [Jeotgalicoccus coquinae]